MTFPPEKIGDKGQRYEVRAFGYPKPDAEAVVGWASDLAGADQMAAAIRKAPGCTSTTIYDRKERLPIITMFAGGHPHVR